MSNPNEKGLIIKKETIYDKIRKNLFAFMYKKDYQMIKRLDELIVPKRPNEKIVIPKEIGKNIKKMKGKGI